MIVLTLWHKLSALWHIYISAAAYIKAEFRVVFWVLCLMPFSDIIFIVPSLKFLTLNFFLHQRFRAFTLIYHAKPEKLRQANGKYTEQYEYQHISYYVIITLFLNANY